MNSSNAASSTFGITSPRCSDVHIDAVWRVRVGASVTEGCVTTPVTVDTSFLDPPPVECPSIGDRGRLTFEQATGWRHPASSAVEPTLRNT